MKYYNRTNTCDRCGIKFKTTNVRREYNDEGNWIGKWICNNCYQKEWYSKTKIPKSKNYYNKTNTCDRCGISFDKTTGHPMREYNNKGNWTGKWDCSSCYQKYDHNSPNNIKKSLRGCRTGFLDSNSNCAKGEKILKLTCELYGYDDLNKIYDNFNTPIDCRDPKTGKLYQIQGRIIKPSGIWGFYCENEFLKDYEEMICFCKSRDGKIIERIYRFPFYEILGKTGVTITENPIKKDLWYEQYRIKDEEFIRKANDIWKIINE